MVVQALNILKIAFQNCVSWFGQILEAVDGGGVLIAAFIIVLTVSLFLIPLRGGGITVDGFRDFTSQATYSASHHGGKYYSGKRKIYGGSKGAFSKRSVGGHRSKERY